MIHKRNLQLIWVFVSLILSMTVLSGCDFNLRDKRFPRKITFPSEGDTITSNLDFNYYYVEPKTSNPDDIFCIFKYDTVFVYNWLKVEVSSKDRSTRFMVEPNKTGQKRKIELHHYGPDDTYVDIIQNR